MTQMLSTEATGGTITTSNFKVHTFTGDGCFVVSMLFLFSNKIDYLVFGLKKSLYHICRIFSKY